MLIKFNRIGKKSFFMRKNNASVDFKCIEATLKPLQFDSCIHYSTFQNVPKFFKTCFLFWGLTLIVKFQKDYLCWIYAFHRTNIISSIFIGYCRKKKISAKRALHLTWKYFENLIFLIKYYSLSVIIC